jgi:Fe2+ or Zn2+ uptake regulation protein
MIHYLSSLVNVREIDRHGVRQRINSEASTAKADLIAILEDRGFRATRQRRDVVERLDKTEGGFSVEEINAQLSGVGRATVYRTVKILLEAGVLCKLALPDGAPKYSLARAEHHHHTICVRCGDVGTFRDVTLERLLRAMGDDVSGEIVGHRIEVYITCLECLAKAPP